MFTFGFFSPSLSLAPLLPPDGISSSMCPRKFSVRRLRSKRQRAREGGKRNWCWSGLGSPEFPLSWTAEHAQHLACVCVLEAANHHRKKTLAVRGSASRVRLQSSKTNSARKLTRSHRLAREKATKSRRNFKARENFMTAMNRQSGGPCCANKARNVSIFVRVACSQRLLLFFFFHRAPPMLWF